jgi:hypothetical protein
MLVLMFGIPSAAQQPGAGSAGHGNMPAQGNIAEDKNSYNPTYEVNYKDEVISPAGVAIGSSPATSDSSDLDYDPKQIPGSTGASSWRAGFHPPVSVEKTSGSARVKNGLKNKKSETPSNPVTSGPNLVVSEQNSTISKPNSVTPGAAGAKKSLSGLPPNAYESSVARLKVLQPQGPAPEEDLRLGSALGGQTPKQHHSFSNSIPTTSARNGGKGSKKQEALAATHSKGHPLFGKSKEDSSKSSEKPLAGTQSEEASKP